MGTQPATTHPSGPVDPFNCAVDPENTWAADKKEWCCRVHHRGCPPTAPPQPILTIAPMVSQTGKQVGPCQRRTGAAEFMARAVRIKAVAAHQQLAGVLRSRADIPWQRFCCQVTSHV